MPSPKRPKVILVNQKLLFYICLVCTKQLLQILFSRRYSKRHKVRVEVLLDVRNYVHGEDCSIEPGSHSVIKSERNDTFEFRFLVLFSRLSCRVYLYSSANMSASVARH